MTIWNYSIRARRSRLDLDVPVQLNCFIVFTVCISKMLCVFLLTDLFTGIT